MDSLALGSATIAVKDRTSFTFDAPALTYHVIYGPRYAQVLARYNQPAGGSLMPPLWAFDAIWWRDDHHADFAANGVTSTQLRYRISDPQIKKPTMVTTTADNR